MLLKDGKMERTYDYRYKDNKIIVDKVIHISLALLIFLCFSFPVNLQEIKVALLLILCFLNALYKKIIVSRKIKHIVFLWLLFAIPVSLIGIVNSNLGAFAFIKVELLYPTIIFFAMLPIKSKKSINSIIQAMFFSGIFISLYTFSLLIYNMGKWFLPFFWIIDDTSLVGLHDGYTHITNTNLSMLIFIYPFIVLLDKKSRNQAKISNSHYILFIILCSIAMFLSGRRILWIVLFGTMLLFILKMKVSMRNKIRILIFIFIFAFLFILSFGETLGLSIPLIINRFFQAFSKIDEYGNTNVRLVQMEYLFSETLKSPLFGRGAGAIIQDYYRSKETPWIFEMSYHMILYNSGFVFFTFYVLSLLLLITSIFLRIKCRLFYPTFVALIMCIFANATNPYFSASFDFLFMIMIPLFILNNYEVIKSDREKISRKYNS